MLMLACGEMGQRGPSDLEMTLLETRAACLGMSAGARPYIVDVHGFFRLGMLKLR